MSVALERDDRLEEETGITSIFTPSRARALEAPIACIRRLTARLKLYLPRWAVRQLKGIADTLEIFRMRGLTLRSLCAAQQTGRVHALRGQPGSACITALWTLGGPAVLTSGTLAVSGSFAGFKQMLGSERIIEPVSLRHCRHSTTNKIACYTFRGTYPLSTARKMQRCSHNVWKSW